MATARPRARHPTGGLLLFPRCHSTNRPEDRHFLSIHPSLDLHIGWEIELSNRKYLIFWILTFKEYLKKIETRERI